MQNITSITQSAAGNVTIRAGKTLAVPGGVLLTDTSTGTNYKLTVTDGVFAIVEA